MFLSRSDHSWYSQQSSIYQCFPLEIYKVPSVTRKGVDVTER